MKNVVIVDSVRSAVGRALKGTLAQTRPDELAGEVMAGLLARHKKLDPAAVEDVVLGCAMPEAEQGLNVARISAMLAGMPAETAAMTINRFCSSGLQALALGAGAILLGSNDLVIAGGVESMSMVPMGGHKFTLSPVAMEKVPDVYTPMGITAENVAKKYGVTREQQDAFALSSHKKAAAAIEAKKFEDELVTVSAVSYADGKRATKPFRRDELVRPDTTLEGLAGLKPSFSLKGTVTPGNASPLSDGAAATLMASEEKAKQLGLPVLGYFRHYVTVGVDPTIMGIGPIPAIRKLFEKTKLSIKDIDLFEINEAFAAQAVYVQRELGIPDEKLNVNGGAIALGHPLGCTGAKLVATALHELRRRKGKYAIVSMCIGFGQGAAGLLELA